MRFKMAYNVVRLTIFFEIAKNGFFIFRMGFMSSINYKRECTSGYNKILMNFGFK